MQKRYHCCLVFQFHQGAQPISSTGRWWLHTGPCSSWKWHPLNGQGPPGCTLDESWWIKKTGSKKWFFCTVSTYTCEKSEDIVHQKAGWPQKIRDRCLFQGPWPRVKRYLRKRNAPQTCGRGCSAEGSEWHGVIQGEDTLCGELQQVPLEGLFSDQTTAPHTALCLCMLLLFLRWSELCALPSQGLPHTNYHPIEILIPIPWVTMTIDRAMPFMLPPRQMGAGAVGWALTTAHRRSFRDFRTASKKERAQMIWLSCHPFPYITYFLVIVIFGLFLLTECCRDA